MEEMGMGYDDRLGLAQVVADVLHLREGSGSRVDVKIVDWVPVFEQHPSRAAGLIHGGMPASTCP